MKILNKIYEFFVNWGEVVYESRKNKAIRNMY